jgi:hypothetical protein
VHAPGPAHLIPAGTVVALAWVSGDIGAALAAGVATTAALLLRRAAATGAFGFADGFTPFRRELGWPRGVQEDDDFHWSWSGGGSLGDEPASRHAPVPR